MIRFLRLASGVLALLLIPVVMYVALVHLQPLPDIRYAQWGPIVVLLLDSSLFYVAFGIWPMKTGDRLGLSFVLPLLIAMASWAAMMGMVSAQMPAGD